MCSAPRRAEPRRSLSFSGRRPRGARAARAAGSPRTVDGRDIEGWSHRGRGWQGKAARPLVTEIDVGPQTLRLVADVGVPGPRRRGIGVFYSTRGASRAIGTTRDATTATGPMGRSASCSPASSPRGRRLRRPRPPRRHGRAGTAATAELDHGPRQRFEAGMACRSVAHGHLPDGDVSAATAAESSSGRRRRTTPRSTRSSPITCPRDPDAVAHPSTLRARLAYDGRPGRGHVPRVLRSLRRPGPLLRVPEDTHG